MMNLDDYKLSLNEFLLIMRNVCSYEPNLDYESISASIKREVKDYFMHESLQAYEFIVCVDSTLNDIDISDDDKKFFFDCLLQRLRSRIIENQQFPY